MTKCLCLISDLTSNTRTVNYGTLVVSNLVIFFERNGHETLLFQQEQE